MDPDKCLEEIYKHLFYENGDYTRCLELIEALAEWISADGSYPQSIYHFDWEEILIGAWWFCVNYHSGQSSDEYRLQCVIGRLYTPGRCQNSVEEGNPKLVYDALIELES